MIPILIIALLLRLYSLTTPLADWHSFRQADTASVAREYVKHGIDLLRPRYQDLSDIQSGRDNLAGYRMVEFPYVSALVAATYPQVMPLHVYYRLIDILFSLGSTYLLYLITRKLINRRVALMTALMFAVLPYNVYYSRTVLPEIPLVFFSLFTMWLFISEKYLPSALAASLALLLKPTAAIFFPPLFVYLVSQRGWKKLPLLPLTIWLLIAVIPLVLWRQWILGFPSGIPSSLWLLNGNGIRLRPAWFRWLFYERLTKLILGYLGLIPFIAGFWLVLRKINLTLLTWIFTSLAYLVVIATGNVQHDYYQIILIPLVCTITTLGLDFVWSKKIVFGKCLVIGACILGIVFGWRQISGYYHINNWAIIEAGAAVDRLTPPDALVIAPYQGDTAFLYATNRRGWPIGFSIDKKIHDGANYYVSTTYDDEARGLEKRYPVIQKNDQFILLKLQ